MSALFGMVQDLRGILPPEPPLFLGLQKGGVSIGHRLWDLFMDGDEGKAQWGTLDVSFYRDDLATRLPRPEATQLPSDIQGRCIVLVDDVIASGRTVRAAFDAIRDYGRPSRIILVALADRGGRELPIAPDVVGLYLDVPPESRVQASLEGIFVS